MYIDESKKIFGLTRYAKSLIAFTGILIGFILSRIFLIMPFIVQDNSMNPGLKKGDYILVLKITPTQEGDIILLKSPVEPERVILKRLLARGEKIVEIKNKKIFINNMEFIPRWDLLSNDRRVFPENFSNRDNLRMKIKKGKLFAIGDNLDYSFDSRALGELDERSIIGKMIYKF